MHEGCKCIHFVKMREKFYSNESVMLLILITTKFSIMCWLTRYLQ